MFDIILDTLGVALLLGQAAFFYVSAEASVGAAPAARSVLPTAGVSAQPDAGKPV